MLFCKGKEEKVEDLEIYDYYRFFFRENELKWKVGFNFLDEIKF